MERHTSLTTEGSALMQHVSICFVSGVVGAVAVVLFGRILFILGVSQALGVTAPPPLGPPVIYKLLFWGGLWGIPFGLFMKAAWKRLYLIGFLYFLAPVLALFLVFLPRSGAGFFGLQQGGPMITVYYLLVNLPFGIIMALTARAIVGKNA